MTPWTVAHQAPPSMGFSRKEYWSGVQLPSLDLALTQPNYQAHFSIGLFVVHVLFFLGKDITANVGIILR